MQKIEAVRGMHDLLPSEARKFYYLLDKIQQILDLYGFEPIMLPLLEKTELFARSIGNDTDIVAKEMYTFLDRNEDSLTLRPEGTAGCVRAVLDHNLTYHQVQKLWYVGPMFRYERPQKGRYRQFYQLGVEAFGLPGPNIDAEILVMLHTLWQALGLKEAVQLELNNLGALLERKAYQEALVAYLETYAKELDPDSQRRLYTNPLRIFDSKVEHTQQILHTAPKLKAYLGTDTLKHFDDLQRLLDETGVKYIINEHLVRGLDYYNLTVFEWTSPLLGAQATVCAGGRYDTLVQELGGTPTPAFGFAMGLERLMLMLDDLKAYPNLEAHPEVYLILAGSAAELLGFRLGETLRQAGIRVAQSYEAASFKNQFKKADKSGALLALILGEEELARQVVKVKFLRAAHPQMDIAYDKIIPVLTELLNSVR